MVGGASMHIIQALIFSSQDRGRLLAMFVSKHSCVACVCNVCCGGDVCVQCGVCALCVVCDMCGV